MSRWIRGFLSLLPPNPGLAPGRTKSSASCAFCVPVLNTILLASSNHAPPLALSSLPHCQALRALTVFPPLGAAVAYPTLSTTIGASIPQAICTSYGASKYVELLDLVHGVCYLFTLLKLPVRGVNLSVTNSDDGVGGGDSKNTTGNVHTIHLPRILDVRRFFVMPGGSAQAHHIQVTHHPITLSQVSGSLPSEARRIHNPEVAASTPAADSRTTFRS
ncbi:hypothetical protein EDB89DRAFT_2129988 [Lactarius sanguifluus]|nr:hypothetical protein EDB89DRAFT_2129988 [Lactarius sanguifluus]